MLNWPPVTSTYQKTNIQRQSTRCLVISNMDYGGRIGTRIKWLDHMHPVEQNKTETMRKLFDIVYPHRKGSNAGPFNFTFKTTFNFYKLISVSGPHNDRLRPSQN